MDKSERDEHLAIFRYSLIAGVLHRDLARGEQAAVLREMAEKEWTLPDGTQRRFSVRTLKRYLQRRRQEGLDGLKPKRRRDAGRRKALPDAAWELAQQLKREEPRRSARTILKILEAQGMVEAGQVSRPTLSRHLHRAGLTRKALLQDTHKTYRRWQRQEPGDLWQIDATGGLWLPEGDTAQARQYWCLQAEDDASRLIVAARFYPHAHQASLDDLLLRAIRRWGVPRAVYVDRGSIFISHHFRRVCAELGIHWIPGTPYYPEGHGKIENRNRLLKEEFLPEAELDIAAGRITTPEALNRALEAWVNYVNHRLHRETKQKPIEVYGAQPHNPYPDPLALGRIFLWRKTVRVDKFGAAPLEGNRYEVGAEFRHRRVELRYDPFDLGQAELWVDGEHRGLVRPMAVVERVAEPLRRDPPPKPSTGLSLLSVLVAEFEAGLHKLAADIPFRALPAADGPTLAGLVVRLEEMLGRALRPDEQVLLSQRWQTCGALSADTAADRLRPILPRIGRTTPLTDILDILWKE